MYKNLTLLHCLLDKPVCRREVLDDVGVRPVLHVHELVDKVLGKSARV